jgi:hypothetical protein
LVPLAEPLALGRTSLDAHIAHARQDRTTKARCAYNA